MGHATSFFVGQDAGKGEARDSGGGLRLTTVLEEAALLGNAAMVDLLLTQGASLPMEAEKRLLGKLLKEGLDEVIAGKLQDFLKLFRCLGSI